VGCVSSGQQLGRINIPRNTGVCACRGRVCVCVCGVGWESGCEGDEERLGDIWRGRARTEAHIKLPNKNLCAQLTIGESHDGGL
jgi:hypothetical protein